MKIAGITFNVLLGASITILFSCLSSHATAQQAAPALEQRVAKLEADVGAFDSTIIELSNNLNQSIQEYTQGLEASLENYSLKLQMSIDERLNEVEQKSIVLNPYERSYQSIETNTGIFLIAIERVEKIDNGFQLHLNIGNPNYADFQNFKLKFFWGAKWDGNQTMPYTEWRKMLHGAEFSFQGKIEKGMWNAMTVDLISVEESDLSYLECEMIVSGVELGYK